MWNSDDNGVLLDAVTIETKALAKAEEIQSRIPMFHLLSKTIVSLDDVRMKSV